ncbi:hypothetical protein ABK040_013236 [Willaertia magna]
MMLNCNEIQNIIHCYQYIEKGVTISFYYKLIRNKFINLLQNNILDCINVVKNENQYSINENDLFEIYSLQITRYNENENMSFNLSNLQSLQELHFVNYIKENYEFLLNYFYLSNLTKLIILNNCNLQIPFNSLKNLTELRIRNSSNIKLFNNDDNDNINNELSSIAIENVTSLQIDLTINCPKLTKLLVNYYKVDKENINLKFKYVPLLENVNISSIKSSFTTNESNYKKYKKR